MTATPCLPYELARRLIDALKVSNSMLAPRAGYGSDADKTAVLSNALLISEAEGALKGEVYAGDPFMNGLL